MTCPELCCAINLETNLLEILHAPDDNLDNLIGYFFCLGYSMNHEVLESDKF